MISTKARKQRKAFFNAPLHQRRKQLSSHLEENLLLKYDKRRIPIVKGDTVKIMRGAFKGHENKVTKVHLKKHTVEIEGVTLTKADGKQIAKPVHPSNLLITKLNLTDKWRRQRLEEGLSSETKKEIEKEASTQLKEIEEQRKKEEELRKQAEEAAAAEEEEASVEEETMEPEESVGKASEEPKATEEKKKKETKKAPDAEPEEVPKKEEQDESEEEKA